MKRLPNGTNKKPIKSKVEHGSHLELPLEYDPERTFVQLDCETADKYLIATSPDGEVVRCLIDGRWVQTAINFTWRVTTNRRREYTYFWTEIRIDGKIRPMPLHRLIYILSKQKGLPPENLVLDHRDRDPLNNCELNLRALPPVLNYFNSDYVVDRKSQFPGVYWIEDSKEWRSILRFDRKESVVGDFTLEEDAARDYLAALMKACPEADWSKELIEEFFPGIQHPLAEESLVDKTEPL